MTGGAKRLGREIAVALAERGANVAVHYHTSVDAAREVVRAARARGVDAMAVRADQRRAAHVRRAVAQVGKEKITVKEFQTEAKFWRYLQVQQYNNLASNPILVQFYLS
ncbi:MAG: SDR family NAD(P)-dependent oxidoreductase, partial [Verrucomicrobiae bacterium]|nr:SDR family NAD(P)-dependent oxidoreductase [Verrucomicrobiae bacterium]